MWPFRDKEKEKRLRTAEVQADNFERFIALVIAREFPGSKWAGDWKMTLENEITTSARSAIYKAAGNTSEDLK